MSSPHHGVWSLALAVACLLTSCAAPVSSPLASAPLGSSGPLFWHVSDSNGGSGYLLGSIHVGPEGGWKLSPVIEEAFRDADVLVVEVDMRSKEAQESVQRLVYDRARLPTGTSLDDLIDRELAVLFDERAPALGLPMHDSLGVKPWMIAMSIAVNQLQELGFDPQSGVDWSFLLRAGDKRVHPLETPEMQIALFDDLPIETQALMLEDALLRSEEIESYFNELFAAWVDGDEDLLTAILFAETHPQLEGFYRAAYLDRNQSMARQISKLIDSGESIFAVIGSAHVVGDEGIPAKLRGAGYDVRQLLGQ